MMTQSVYFSVVCAPQECMTWAIYSPSSSWHLNPTARDCSGPKRRLWTVASNFGLANSSPTHLPSRNSCAIALAHFRLRYAHGRPSLFTTMALWHYDHRDCPVRLQVAEPPRFPVGLIISHKRYYKLGRHGIETLSSFAHSPNACCARIPSILTSGSLSLLIAMLIIWRTV